MINSIPTKTAGSKLIDAAKEMAAHVKGEITLPTRKPRKSRKEPKPQ